MVESDGVVCAMFSLTLLMGQQELQQVFQSTLQQPLNVSASEIFDRNGIQPVKNPLQQSPLQRFTLGARPNWHFFWKSRPVKRKLNDF